MFRPTVHPIESPAASPSSSLTNMQDKYRSDCYDIFDRGPSEVQAAVRGMVPFSLIACATEKQVPPCTLAEGRAPHQAKENIGSPERDY